jgi:hypothetical protein
MPERFYIGGSEIDFTKIEKNSLSIDRQLAFTSDQCKFSIFDYRPAEGQEVIIRDDDGTILFGGVVVSSVLARRSGDRQVTVYDVDCDDYTAVLDGKLVVETYRGLSADEIFLDIVHKYITGFTTYGVAWNAPTIEDTGPDLSYLRPSEAFRYLCEYVGWVWKPTYTKDLRFARESDLYGQAPVVIEKGTKAVLGKYSIDIQGLRNRVFVLGGKMLSDHEETRWLADGVARQWWIPFGPHDMSFFVSDSQYSVGVENLHKEENFDFMMSFSEKYIRCSADTPTPVAGTQLTLIAKREIPVITTIEDLASQAAVKAIQGGDGVYEHVITDNLLVTVQAAEAVAQADLNLHANPKIQGDFTTEIPGWFPGQTVRIDMPHRGISGSYMVQRVSIRRILSKGEPIRWQYTVTYGGRLLGIADFLQSLISRQQRERGEETSVINKMVYSDDKIALSDEELISEEGLPFRYDEARSVWGVVVLV